MVCVKFISIIHPQTISHLSTFGGTATYNLAKFFVPILKEFTVDEYTVSDSFSFCKEIKDRDSSLFMASFDSHSLLTSLWTKY